MTLSAWAFQHNVRKSPKHFCALKEVFTPAHNTLLRIRATGLGVAFAGTAHGLMVWAQVSEQQSIYALTHYGR